MLNEILKHIPKARNCEKMAPELGLGWGAARNGVSQLFMTVTKTHDKNNFQKEELT